MFGRDNKEDHASDGDTVSEQEEEEDTSHLR